MLLPVASLRGADGMGLTITSMPLGAAKKDSNLTSTFFTLTLQAVRRPVRPNYLPVANAAASASDPGAHLAQEEVEDRDRDILT